MLVRIDFGAEEVTFNVDCSEHNFWGSMIPGISDFQGKATVNVALLDRDSDEITIKTNHPRKYIVELAKSIR